MKRRVITCCQTKKIIMIICTLILTISCLFALTEEDSHYKAIEEYKGLPSIEARLQLAYNIRKSNYNESYFQAKRAFSEAKNSG